MLNSPFGVALTYLAPFGVIAAAAALRKLGAAAETSRKFAHILLSHWILLALAVYQSPWIAAIAPASFILINYLTYRKLIYSPLERDDNETPGTVWYAVSLCILCFVGFALEMPWIAACGMLAMGYGDGFGALVGKRWGKHPFPHAPKSLEGMATVALFSALAVGAVAFFYAPELTLPFIVQMALACAVPAAAIELYSPRGFDNVTLPLGVSAMVYLLVQFPALLPLFTALSIGLLILLLAYYLRAITFWALQAATLLGAALFIFGEWLLFAALVAFFLLGSSISRAGKKRKADAVALHQRQGARTVAQVAANGLPPLIFGALYFFIGGDAFLLAALACLAAASADTFSSEMGMLSARPPRSILTFRPIQKGLSGGVSPLGLLGALLGAGVLSLFALPRFGASGALVVIAVGFVCALLDSLLGATLQAKYQHQHQLTERETANGRPLTLAHGVRWMNNDAVNFIAPMLGALALVIIW